MSRWTYAAVFVTLGASLAVLGAGQGAAQAQSTGPCRLAKGESPVARACAEGGIVRAKQVMRSLMKQARGAGVRYECSDCHSDDRSYDRLTADARDKFARLLAAAPKK